MARERKENLNNVSDREYIKRKMKKIKQAKKNGNDLLAERHADELYAFLGWDDGF